MSCDMRVDETRCDNKHGHMITLWHIRSCKPVGAVNELESRAFPSFLRRGGCASKKWPPFLDWRSRGGSYPTHNPPGRSLGLRPPLLGKEGNALDSNSFTPFVISSQICLRASLTAFAP